MKTISALLFTVLTAAVLVGCKKNDAPEAPKAGADAKAAAKPYPLDVCIVAGEKLGSMGQPHVIVHEGQEIKFCCSGCEPDFKKEPAKFLAKLAPKK